MGFTRTSEGRVFFKGADNDDGPRSDAAAAPLQQSSSEASSGSPSQQGPALSVDHTQMQILLLLKSLNTKLKSSKEEQVAMRQQLAAYKETIKKIKDKANNYENNYIDLEQKVARKQTEAQKQVSRVEDTLKDTLRQLDEARKLVEELENKEDTKSETLEELKTLVQERKAEEEKILKRQKDLEKAQNAQGEKMVDHVAAYVALTKRVSESEAKQASLHNKVEETTSEFLKLDRKIDKAVEDRNRILRKIERIEAAVMETRDALNAKAMVLLTQQQESAAANSSAIEKSAASPAPAAAMQFPQIEITGSVTNPQIGDIEDDTDAQWWQKSIRLSAASFAALLFAVLVMGWLVSLVFAPSTPDTEQKPRTYSALDHKKVIGNKGNEDDLSPFSMKADLGKTLNPDLANEVLNEVTESKKTPETDDTAIATLEPAIQDGTEQAQPPPEDTTTAAKPAPTDDYGITIHKGANNKSKDAERLDIKDEQATLEAMESDPDKVAAELNKIEPVDEPPAIQLAQVESSQLTPQTDAQEQHSATETAPAVEASYPELQDKQTYKEYLRKAATPDSDLPPSVQKVEKQAFDGNPEAQHDMGAIYIAGHGPVKQNLKRAVFWFEESSKNNVANAQYNLGVLYHQGLGVEKDIGRAIELYEKAARKNHPEAQYNLGIANIEGIGVPYNPQKAATYFENAANQNIMEAAYNLGLIYENGLLGETRPDEALMWYKTAAERGSPEAKTALEHLASTLGISLNDVNRVVEKARASKKSPSAAASQSTDLSQQDITAGIQQELMDRGLYPGPVDGMNGPMTANAIKNFQSSKNLAADGIPSKDLLDFMRGNRR